MSTLTLIFLVFLGSPFIRLAAAANQCFGADDGGYDMMTNKGGVLYHAVRDYVSQDCANNKNWTNIRMANELMVCRGCYRHVMVV